MNGDGRQPFSEREKAFIRAERARDPPTSYGQIARELGKRYPDDNGGSRSRHSVYGFAASDPERTIRLQVALPASLVERARGQNYDLSATLADTLRRRLRGQSVIESLQGDEEGE